MKKALLFIPFLCTGVLLAATAKAADGNLIVQMRDGVSLSTIAARYQSSVDVKDFTPGAPFVLFAPKPGQDVDTIEAVMMADTDLVLVEDDGKLSMPEGERASRGTTIASIGSRSTLYAMNTGMLQQIRFNPSRANSSSGRQVRVAILDTGMSAQRPELWAKTVASINLIEPGQPAYDMPRGHNSNGNGLIDEGTGHGSMVAGLIDQIAPQVKLVVVRAADSDGVTSGWNLIKGLAFAVVNGAEVANISFGTYEGIPALGDIIENWCDAKGLLVVAPIGNDNIREVMEPADRSSVVCVAGVDDEDEKASFSNWDNDVLVSAPATGIRSYWWDGQLAVWDGTSFAAPMVTASIADCLRRRRPLAPWKIRTMLLRYGDNINGSNASAYRNRLGLRLNIGKLEVGLRMLR